MARPAKKSDDGSDKERATGSEGFVDGDGGDEVKSAPQSQEGTSVPEYIRNPVEKEVWRDYLMSKVEDGLRGPLRFYLKRVKLEILASALKSQLPLELMKVLVHEDDNLLVCGDPTHETPHEFRGVAVLVLGDEPQEQKNEEGNVYPPIPGLPPEVAQFVLRNYDGSPKVSGSVFKQPVRVVRDDGRRRQTGWERVPMCGPFYTVGKDEEGWDVEKIHFESHYGIHFRRTVRDMKNEGKAPRVYTYTWEGAQKAIEFSQRRYEENKVANTGANRLRDERFGRSTPDSSRPGIERGERRGGERSFSRARDGRRW